MKRLFLGVAGILIALFGLLTYRALSFVLEQPPVTPLERFDVDPRAKTRLSEVIQIRTVTKSEPPYYDPSTFERLASHVAHAFPLTHTRLSTETVGQHGLLYHWKGSGEGRPFLLMAHQDVVPIAPGTEGDWEHPPFSGAIADGFVWGRGTMDDKAAMMAMLEATERLLAEGFEPKRAVYFAFGHDEEIGGRDGAENIAKTLAARDVRLEFVLDEGGVIVNDVIPDVSVPIALVGVAEKGYVSLKLTARAEGGHSSMPPNETAIGVLSNAIAALEANQFPVRMTHSIKFFEFVGPQMPFFKRLVFANLWLFKPIIVDILTSKHTTAATIRTTTAPTIIRAGEKDNVLPQSAMAVVNFRIIPSETPESVLLQVRATIGDERVSVEPYAQDGAGFGSPPSRTSSIESDAFAMIASTIRGVSTNPDLVVAPSLVVGATDSRYFSEIADDVYRFNFVPVGPTDIPRVHGTNERIRVEDYENLIRFYYWLLKKS